MCKLFPCSSSVTPYSFLLFSNPSCMGQHMARASIWAPSPAYLLDTQVGTIHPSPLSSAPTPFFLIHHVNWVRSVFVTRLVILVHFSHVWDFHTVLVCCSVLCDQACVSPTIKQPCVILWLYKMGPSMVLCVFVGCFLFFQWACSNCTLKPHLAPLCLFLLKHTFRVGFEDRLALSVFIINKPLQQVLQLARLHINCC